MLLRVIRGMKSVMTRPRFIGLRAELRTMHELNKKLEGENKALYEDLAESKRKGMLRYKEDRATTREADSLRKDAVRIRRQRDVLYDNLLVNADTPMEVYVVTNEIAEEGLAENQA